MTEKNHFDELWASMSESQRAKFLNTCSFRHILVEPSSRGDMRTEFWPSRLDEVTYFGPIPVPLTKHLVGDILTIKGATAGVGAEEFPRGGIRAASALNLLAGRARWQMSQMGSDAFGIPENQTTYSNDRAPAVTMESVVKMWEDLNKPIPLPPKMHDDIKSMLDAGAKIEDLLLIVPKGHLHHENPILCIDHINTEFGRLAVKESEHLFPDTAFVINTNPPLPKIEYKPYDFRSEERDGADA